MWKNIKAMLGGAFNRMILVTREEFDIQQQVLIKTRTKLAALEARLAKLEAAQNPERALKRPKPLLKKPSLKSGSKPKLRIRPSEICRLPWFTAAP